MNSDILIGVLIAVFVFFTKEVIAYYWLDQVRLYRSIRLDIAEKLALHARVYSNFSEGMRTNDGFNAELRIMRDDLKGLSARLSAFVSQLPSCCPEVPSKKNMISAKKSLTYISNADNRGQSIDACLTEAANIREQLNIPRID